jgi:hypothetical protein
MVETPSGIHPPKFAANIHGSAPKWDKEPVSENNSKTMKGENW